jgi:phosphoribosylglycinamide formyltransferase-1
MDKPNLLVFASGTRGGGGSGFEKLVEAANAGLLHANIVGVVSNWPAGGVHEKAYRLGIPFRFMPEPYDATSYQALVEEFDPFHITLSGWLKKTRGLDPRKTSNIHPGYLRGPLGSDDEPDYGGEIMYGHYVHEAVAFDLKSGLIPAYSAVTMHFVTEEYDQGPIFFRALVPLLREWGADEIGAAVNKVEHLWQWRILNALCLGEISWDGEVAHGIFVPGYVPIETMPRP